MESVRQALNANSMVIVMLESPEAIERADEIAAVPGVDILHVGSTDLCEAMGISGQFDAPELERCFQTVVDACRRHAKTAGAGGLASQMNALRKMVGMGVRFVTAGIEWDLMLTAARQRSASIRELPLEPRID